MCWHAVRTGFSACTGMHTLTTEARVAASRLSPAAAITLSGRFTAPEVHPGPRRGTPAGQCPESDTLRGLLPERLNPLAVSACFYLHTCSHSRLHQQGLVHTSAHTHTLTQACTHSHPFTHTHIHGCTDTGLYTHSHPLTHAHASPQPRLDLSHLMPGPFLPPVPMKDQPSGAL